MRPGCHRLVGHIQSQGSWSIARPQGGMVAGAAGTARMSRRQSVSVFSSIRQKVSTYSMRRPVMLLGVACTPKSRSGPNGRGCSSAASGGTMVASHSSRGCATAWIAAGLQAACA
ncbi:MAG TPA: hypothetical protein VN280_00415, partial [Variovorax sp.]|nr:hypothetical protein [Variovorax sp.]